MSERSTPEQTPATAEKHLPHFHTPADLTAISRWLSGTEHYFIQAFVDSGDLIGSGQALSEAQMQALLDAVKPCIPNAQLRGI